MKVIGITGGVGAGKSEILNILKGSCNCVIIKADDLAKELEQSEEECYEPLIELLGEDIKQEDGEIDPKKMAFSIFTDKSGDLLKRVNAIIHPAVKRRILKLISETRKEESVEYFFIEAALLIEDKYEEICDELWYVYADVSVRRMRLKQSRGYSDQKIDDIMSSQLDDKTFRQYCRVVIDNSNDLSSTKEQIENILKKMAD